MLRRLMLPLVCCFAGFASSAHAAPLTLDKSEAVADARRDPGTGICGSVTKFANQPTPLILIDDAINILNKPQGDPSVIAHISRQFVNMNFSVGPGSEADFTAPAFNDDFFPYCLDQNANPMGQDDNNIAMRIRGYLNISGNLVNSPQTIAVKCDDGCLLKIGKSMQIVSQANDDSPTLTGRRARWVTFKDAGLYPVELVYFQNSTTGYLEWSRAPGNLFAGDDVSVDNIAWAQNKAAFAPLSGDVLYSSIVGANPSCIECGAPGMDCSTGNYCGDGLCQSCNVADHCGPTCMTCPANAHICTAGKCVQCTTDADCPAGTKCDTSTNTCGPPTSCTTNDQCPPSQVCRPEGYCGPPPPPCRTNSDCLAGQQCLCADGSSDCTQKVCITPPTKCIDDSACMTGYHCDSAAQICKLNDRYLYEGGLVGCNMGDGNRSAANGLAILALFGIALFGFASRRRESTRA